MGTQESSHSSYKLTPWKLGCEVRGIDLKKDVPKDVIAAIKEDVTKHRVLIFKDGASFNVYSYSIKNLQGVDNQILAVDGRYPYGALVATFLSDSPLIAWKEGAFLQDIQDQGVISGDRHVEIAKWFGEPDSTFYKHPRSPHPDVFRVSNDRTEGCTNVGRTGWHIDGSFQEAPFAYSLYHMVHVPTNGPTVFCPLTEIIEELPRDKRIRWERLYMISDRRSGPIHPLIYSHPLTKKKVLCFHLGMTEGFIWDYKTPEQRSTSEEETYAILQEIHHEFIKDNKARQYRHEWSVGDFIISDNLSVAHEAAPESQLPRSKVDLRVLHRVTTVGHCPPTKEYDYRKELGL